MWAVEDPSTASIPVNYQGSTTQTHTTIDHSSSPLQSPPSAREQVADSVPDYGGEIRLQFPYITHDQTSRAMPEPGSVAVNLSAGYYPPTTPGPESSTHSPPPPIAWTEDFGVSAAPSSAYIPPSAPDSAISATQRSWWCNDRFIAVYQSFFVPPSIDDHRSRSPALARGNIHCPDTLGAEQVNSGPDPQDHGQACTAPAPASTGNTTRPDTADQCEVPPAPGSVSWSLDADGVFIDWSVPPAMAAPAAPVDRTQWVALEMAAMAGYAQSLHLQASLVPSAIPEEAYAAVYSSLPTVLSSHSELAHAFAGSPQPFAYANPSALPEPATARCRKPSRTDVAWAQTLRQDRSAAPPSSSL
ncbi:hypothetical protein V8D89_001915 [Ganoderma adspersum]